MILDNVTQAYGPGMTAVFGSAAVWVSGMLIVLYHRAGLQVLGAAIAFVGFLLMVLNVQILLAASLLAFGFAVHSCGRLLFHLKRRG
ncbi:MAG: hypothetical protein GC154_06555 [bacterium]|nr:hypothetical protein [bacterium]